MRQAGKPAAKKGKKEAGSTPTKAGKAAAGGATVEAVLALPKMHELAEVKR